MRRYYCSPLNDRRFTFSFTPPLARYYILRVVPLYWGETLRTTLPDSGQERGDEYQAQEAGSTAVGTGETVQDAIIDYAEKAKKKME